MGRRENNILKINLGISGKVINFIRSNILFIYKREPYYEEYAKI